MTPQQLNAMKQAFEAHCKDERHHTVAETQYWCRQYKLIAQAAIAALSEHAMRETQRLGQEIEQEPVQCNLCDDSGVGSFGVHSMCICQYAKAAPPQRKPLTDEEILSAARGHYNPYQRPEISFARAIEAAHGIKD